MNVYVKCIIIPYFYLWKGKGIFLCGFNGFAVSSLHFEQTSTFPKKAMKAASSVPTFSGSVRDKASQNTVSYSDIAYF